MKKQLHLMLSVLFFFGTVVALAQDTETLEAQTQDADQESMSDQKTGSFDSQEFVKTVASAGMMETKLGEMASEKAASEAVKEYGQTMVEDHGKANEELKSLASSNNLTVPESMLEKHQKTVDKLSDLSGEEFDKEYMKTMVKDHKKDIKEFEKAAEKADNSEVQAWAQKTVEVLKQHLQMAEDTQQSVQASAN